MTARLVHIWQALTSPQTAWLALWLGLAAITVSLLVLMRTRWGETKPLGKCTLLSVLAHLLLAAYLSTVRLFVGNAAAPRDLVIRVLHFDGTAFNDEQSLQPTAKTPPWEVFDSPTADIPAEAEPAKAEPQPPTELQQEPRFDLDPLAGTLPVADLPEPPPPLEQPEATSGYDLADRDATESTPPTPIEAPPAERRESADTTPPATPLDRPALDLPDLDIPPAPAPATAMQDAALEPPLPAKLADLPSTSDAAQALSDNIDAATRQSSPAPTAEVVPLAPQERFTAAPQGAAEGAPASASDVPAGGPANPTANTAAADGRLTDPTVDAGQAVIHPDDVPAIMRHRVAPDRAHVAAEQGGTPQSEAAVNEALAWLARNQSSDGRWDAKKHGAGRETQIDGRNRGGAGARADTGVTGLALLAFLGSGQSHTSGNFRDAVAGGLDYLLRVQRVDGNLGGSAETYALMYCHGMATLALSEAYAMTHDPRLAEPVRKAIGYTLRAQNRSTGGWRYQPGDLGDTSQLGWQLMALKSAELAGVAVPRAAHDGAARFLRSVSAGTHGGLASYRPGERPSRPMTAEALVCKQFLGLPPLASADAEAAAYVQEEPPGAAASNFYYWYYATLALYQLQGEAWERWNESLQSTLVAQQRHDGDAAGSWDPNDTWGPHGGRVYSTAMAALCLEVYYRYLPVYGQPALRHARRDSAPPTP